MQAGGVRCDIVPKTTTTWITFTPMPVACVSTVCKLAQRGAWPRLRLLSRTTLSCLDAVLGFEYLLCLAGCCDDNGCSAYSGSQNGAYCLPEIPCYMLAVWGAHHQPVLPCQREHADPESQRPLCRPVSAGQPELSICLRC